MKTYLKRFAQDIREYPDFWAAAATLMVLSGAAFGAVWWLT
jgi:hypothetical protein